MPLSPLVLSAPQVAAINDLLSLTGPLAQAISAGVTDGSSQLLPLVVPISMKGQPIWPTMTTDQQNQSLQAALIALAAFMVELGLIPPTMPPISATVDYVKSDMVTIGHLTFTNGLLTAST